MVVSRTRHSCTFVDWEIIISSLRNVGWMQDCVEGWYLGVVNVTAALPPFVLCITSVIVLGIDRLLP